MKAITEIINRDIIKEDDINWDNHMVLVPKIPNTHTLVVLSNGKHTDLQFKGTRIVAQKGIENRFYEDWFNKNQFTPVEGHIDIRFSNSKS